MSGFFGPSNVLVGVSPTNASNLGVIVSDGTLIQQQATSGTGNIARVTSPVLVTPTLGVATATSLNNLTITSSTGTLTIAAAKVVTVNNALTLAGTDSTTITFQGTDTYVGRATTDTFTNKTFNSAGTGNVLQVSGVTVSSGQYPGTATNDAATAGNIGQLVESTVLAGAAVSVTTATARDITSISLGAGDWDVWGNIVAAPANTTVITRIIGWISSTSATVPTSPNSGSYIDLSLTFPTSGQTQAIPVGMIRLSLSGTTTVYLSTYDVFSVSTLTAFGYIGARRRR